MNKGKKSNFTSTRNPCKACTPLGATMVFSGVEGAVPLLHGSQGCSTYIRRYLIGHFREPMDIASSNFHENAAVMGGEQNLRVALQNVMQQYSPELIGIATTCLSETIGDDVPMYLHHLKKELSGDKIPKLIPVSTPSYQGSHTQGFHAAVLSLVKSLAKKGKYSRHMNIFPGMVSPADLRHLRELIEAFRIPVTVLPDYSESLDGPAWKEYHRIPPGGTKICEIRRTARARASIEFTATQAPDKTAGAYLKNKFEVPRHIMPLPIGVRLSDMLFALLEDLTSVSTPKEFVAERGRLIDALVDGHKYAFGKRALVVADEDMAVSVTAMLMETGIHPVVCATGGKPGGFEKSLRKVVPDLPSETVVMEDADFMEIEQAAESAQPDLILGNSNCYKLSRKLDIPLIRVGLPIHDRIGAARILSVGYRGTQQLYDRIVNALIERQQDDSPVGYTHI